MNKTFEEFWESVEDTIPMDRYEFALEIAFKAFCAGVFIIDLRNISVLNEDEG